MIPTAFTEDNGILKPPDGWTDDECGTLSAFFGQFTDGTPIVVTCWKPTPGEWEEMRKTGRVWLVVYGEVIPPVAVMGTSPFDTVGEPPK